MNWEIPTGILLGMLENLMRAAWCLAKRGRMSSSPTFVTGTETCSSLALWKQSSPICLSGMCNHYSSQITILLSYLACNVSIYRSWVWICRVAPGSWPCSLCSFTSQEAVWLSADLDWVARVDWGNWALLHLTLPFHQASQSMFPQILPHGAQSLRGWASIWMPYHEGRT